MKLTPEQFQALSPYADEFKRAIASNYCKAPSTPELKQIREIYVAATGAKGYPMSFGCTYCVLQLMKDAGRLYFAESDEQALAAAQREEERKKAAAAKQTAKKPTQRKPSASGAKKPATGKKPGAKSTKK